jgi:hemerythrin superfamily protein
MNMISNLVQGERQDLVAILETDHRDVEQLFTQIQRAQGRQRSTLVENLAEQLTLHMSIEESIVYPRLGRIDEEMRSEAEAEHALARKTLKDLRRLAPDSPGFDGALEMVKAGIEHHVHEEESEAFPRLRAELDEQEMEEITEQVREAKQRGRAPRRRTAAKRSSTSSKAATNQTKADLVERAKREGVAGYSSMTKAELARALR